MAVHILILILLIQNKEMEEVEAELNHSKKEVQTIESVDSDITAALEEYKAALTKAREEVRKRCFSSFLHFLTEIPLYSG